MNTDQTTDTSQDSAVERSTGPAPMTTIFGLALIALAVGLYVSIAHDVTVHWETAGPVALIGGGVVLVLLGAIGMRRRR